MKETIYGFISELLTSSEEFNTSLELMSESAFIGEAATRVVTDHMVKPEDIHNKYKTEMEALITDLILLSMIETGEHSADQEPIDVQTMIGQIGNDARALSGDNNHQIDINVAGQPLLKGDHKQLRSAFSNLVFNAVKYTPPGGQIAVSWRADKDGAQLSVKDTGIGIDSSHIPRLTERFYRADPSRHKDTGGTGLGLAIVKHVLINHDGHLEINSRIGEGSEFICHFPKERLIEGGSERAVR